MTLFPTLRIEQDFSEANKNFPNKCKQSKTIKQLYGSCDVDATKAVEFSYKNKCMHGKSQTATQPKATRSVAQFHLHGKHSNSVSLFDYRLIVSSLLYEVTGALSLLHYIQRQHTINHNTVCNVIITKSIVNQCANMINRSVAFKVVEKMTFARNLTELLCHIFHRHIIIFSMKL